MLTIYDWFGYETPITDRYRLIKATGFDGVLLWWSDTLGRGDYLSGPRLAREAGLFVENVHAPFQIQNDLWEDNLNGESALACYLQCVEDCAALDIPALVVHLPEDSHPCNALGLDRIRELTESAETRGVNIALENIRNRENLISILETADSPRIGFCYDCAHHYRLDPAIDFLARYGHRLMALHLHDNGSDGSCHVLPFDGTVDWPLVMEQIARTGYSGPTAIEGMNWKYTGESITWYLEEAAERGRRLEALRRQPK